MSEPDTAPRRSYQRLAERLQRFMAEGHFCNGDKLPPERTLAESFGVSRSSVRNAIHALAAKGLLESRQGDGTYVRARDMEPLQTAILEAVDSESLLFDEIMEFRSAMEPRIAELAAVRRTATQLDRLKIISCDQQCRLLNEEDDGDLDAQFHLQLAECTGNRLFIKMMELLNDMYASGRTPDLRTLEWRRFSASSHLHIIDGLERQSPEDCRRAVEEHLATVFSKHLFATTRD